jgi:hypothetical protein
MPSSVYQVWLMVRLFCAIGVWIGVSPVVGTWWAVLYALFWEVWLMSRLAAWLVAS